MTKSKLTFDQCKNMIKICKITNPNAIEFIQSCDEYLNKKGFLTESQVDTLNNVKDNRSSYRYGEEYDEIYDHEDRD